MVLTTALIMFIVLVITLLLGFPIAISIGLSSILAILPSLAFDNTLVTGAQRIFSGISNFTLIAIPFFILAGNIMNQGGIAKKLVSFAQSLTGRIPGSLMQTNILANMMFGAISGSATAACAAMGGILLPMEEEQGYDKKLGATANIASAPTGLLIPPSNSLIVYSLVSGGTSVAALFMAGYLPGILWGIGCMALTLYLCKAKGMKGTNNFKLKVVLVTFIDALPSLALIIIVIGGIIKGIFTPTEGSVVAVVYTLILSMLFYRTITIKGLIEIFAESAKMTGIIVFLIGVSTIMSWVMAFTGVPQAISSLILGLTNNKFLILLLMNLLLLFIGTFMDVTPAILIFTPIFLPIVQSFGMSAVQFGIIIVFNLCIGNITPPVGNTLFVGVKVGNLKIEDVMGQLIKYYVVIIIVLMLVTYIPAISMYLPTIGGFVK
ncbi:TRAP transporter large permease [Fusobacterium mortiferum]|jgi:tripartite ATP-independent transporter DctM subunit|uniref:TRAP transporter large permease n=2 Tax=Fusobacterium mortiferum TaxID=850 RepID=A0A414PY97_FUSMR|nr:TRAP transporter large permease [Fusobacterium mortiferum]AVQ19772.1 TRAP transporter large permease [Fusobacterium mortiferum ATCC 9817]EEO35792.1 TRAP transporter, DctM subunit [Fusobacterium mortiferum ATCC 9817]MCI6383189.1 TRAP transporter large permease [Fusobacterium mortiferum]MDD7263354.1 TRAP transporter large permease [Fusobacterium mortiferum]RHF73490.1 TRAP transporter large permease [Fusobacterium mortiferum]